MKKTIYTIMAISAITLVSCNKENAELLSKGKEVTLYVEGNMWEDVKSAVQDDASIKLTGDEPIGLFAKANPSDAAYTGVDKNGANPATTSTYAIKATNNAGVYKFSCPAGLDSYTFYPILPFSLNLTRKSSDGTKPLTRLSSIQICSNNTFDPAMDFLVAEPFTIGEDASAQITKFKRLFAPLRVDVKGIGEKEKVYALTLDFVRSELDYSKVNQVADGLTGNFYYAFSSNFKDVKATNIITNTGSNAVTAMNPTGQEVKNGAFPMWFIVNPVTYQNTPLKVTVVTNKTVYVKEIESVGEKFELMPNCTNHFSVDMSSAQSTSDAVSFSFPTLNPGTGTKSLKATNDTSYSWEFVGSSFKYECATQDGGLEKHVALRLQSSSNSTAKIPEITGKKIKKIRLYASPVQNTNSDNSVLTLTDANGVEKSRLQYNMSGAKGSKLSVNGGFVDFDCPDGVDDMTGYILKPIKESKDLTALITMITLFVE